MGGGMNFSLAGFANDPFNGPSESVTGFGPGGPAMAGGFALGQPPATAPAASDRTGQSVTLTQALADLRTAAADRALSDAKLKRQLDIYRVARERARHELELARQDLRRLLTPDQEALLVLLGYFE